MKFKVVEQEKPKYEDFKKLYLDPSVSREEIMSLLGMSRGMFYSWGRDVSRETGFKRLSKGRPRGVCGRPRNYVDDVFKDFMGDYLFGGFGKDELMGRYGLKEWQYSHLVRKVRGECGFRGKVGCRNYYRTRWGSWVVRKVIEGRLVYFGSYESEETARRVVDFLKRNNWSKDCLGELVL